MKNLCHFLLLASALALALATPEAETKVEELEAEHRSAKPEPFLEKLAAAIFGSNDKTSSKRPVYQQTAGSVQRPVAVKPPRVPLAPRPPQPPRIPLQKRPQPVYNGPQVSASNNVQSFAPPQTGKKNTTFSCLNLLVLVQIGSILSKLVYFCSILSILV